MYPLSLLKRTIQEGFFLFFLKYPFIHIGVSLTEWASRCSCRHTQTSTPARDMQSNVKLTGST